MMNSVLRGPQRHVKPGLTSARCCASMKVYRATYFAQGPALVATLSAAQDTVEKYLSAPCDDKPAVFAELLGESALSVGEPTLGGCCLRHPAGPSARQRLHHVPIALSCLCQTEAAFACNRGRGKGDSPIFADTKIGTVPKAGHPWRLHDDAARPGDRIGPVFDGRAGGGLRGRLRRLSPGNPRRRFGSLSLSAERCLSGHELAGADPSPGVGPGPRGGGGAGRGGTGRLVAALADGARSAGLPGRAEQF